MRFLRYAVVFIVALVGGVAGSAPVYVMGLVVPVTVVGPLALLVGSLLATLFAGWATNLVGRGRSRLFAIFGVSLLAAVVALLLRFAGAWAVNTFEMGLGIGSTLLVYLPGAIFFSVMTAVAALRLRGPGGRLGWDGAAALVLSACGSIFLLLVNPIVPVVPPAQYVLVNYEIVVWASLAVAVLGLLAVAWCYSRGVSGRELARDAAVTLSLLAALLPVVSGTIHVSCSTLVRCGA